MAAPEDDNRTSDVGYVSVCLCVMVHVLTHYLPSGIVCTLSIANTRVELGC